MGASIREDGQECSELFKASADMTCKHDEDQLRAPTVGCDDLMAADLVTVGCGDLIAGI
jgi:hypothetical protein